MADSPTSTDEPPSAEAAARMPDAPGRMRPYGYWRLLRARVREHPLHELLAAAGIAAGVALALAVLTANSSIGRSSGEIVRGVTGSANLQVQARSADGVDGRALLPRIREIPGVRRAAGVLEQHAVIVGPNGRPRSVNVIGVDADLAALSGQLTRSFVRGALSLTRGVVLPTATATSLGLNTGTGSRPAALPRVRVELRGRAERLQVAAVFGSDTLGPLADAGAAVMSVGRLRTIAGLPDRLTRVLIETDLGAGAEVRGRLQDLLGATMTVSDIDAEPRMLDEALKPTAQATTFFAIVAGAVGFLLAFNAVLLSAPDRRRWQADLITINGATPGVIVLLIVIQSLVLAIVGGLAGVALGLLLAGGLLHESPDYLAPAFTLGSRTVVSALPIVVSVAGGTLACLLASVPLMLDLRRGRSVELIDRRDMQTAAPLSRTTTIALLGGAVVLTVAALAILAWLPAAALVACGLLALATVLTVPATFATVIAAAGFVARRRERMVMLMLALRELRGTTLRALALASTGAVAVFGAVAIGGARHDLLRGIENYTQDYVSTADLWITHANDNQATNDFPITAAELARLGTVSGVASVRSYHGGFLDLGDRRVWIIARDPTDRSLVPPSQLRDGTARRADNLIRRGGWASVSDQLADAIGARAGAAIALPTPTGPHQLRVAATTSNLGWSPGAIVMNAADYRSWWNTSTPTALQVDVAPGANPATVASGVQQQLDPTLAGLHVVTAQERAATITASARSGLSRLGQIATMLLIAACLAMAAALGAAIWQRRPRLSHDALIGTTPSEQWRALLIESGLVVGAGCLTGAVFGILGQVVIDRYLVQVTGYPVQIEIATWSALSSFALVLVAALLVLAVPGWFAARVGADVAFQD